MKHSPIFHPSVADYRGPADWQIIQQQNGCAELTVSGRLTFPEGDEAGPGSRARLRLIREDTSRPVTTATGWTEPVADTKDPYGFQHTFRGVPAGGLYRLEIGSVSPLPGTTLRLHRVVHAIGVGDLWILAGQSNAAGIGAGLAEDTPELGVHLLRNDETWALAMHPLNDCTGSTHPNREGRPMHSPYLAFGKTLRRELGIPIGLVQTSLGGSALAAWDPAENGPLYANLLHCVNLAGGKVRGMLWYQGCSDAGPEESRTYGKRFDHFIRTLRKDLEDPGLPVITTQLNRFQNEVPAEHVHSWSWIREVQRQLAHSINALGVVPAIGLPLSDIIHNSTAGNLELGQRYATTALGMVYGRPVAWRFPELESARLEEDTRLRLTFAHVSSSLQVITAIPRDLRVEDDQGEIPVTAHQLETPDSLILELARKPGPGARISSCCGQRPEPSLFDYYEHRPVLAFTNVPIT